MVERSGDSGGEGPARATGDPAGPDWLHFGPTAPRPSRPRRLLATAASVAGLALVGAAVLAQHEADSDSTPPNPTPTASQPAAAPTPGLDTWTGPLLASRRGRATTGPVSFTDHAFALASTVPWELFARSDDDFLYRIRLGNGQVARTDTSRSGPGGPASLVVGPHQVFVSSSGRGPGAVVPDARPARALPGALRRAEQLFPGPPGYLWALSLSDTTSSKVVLTSYAGVPQHTVVKLAGATPQPDGAGNLLLTGGGGVDEASRIGVRRLTTGRVAAVGPHHYLIDSCDSSTACSTYLYDRRSHTRRRVAAADTTSQTTGSVSPNGHQAALLRISPTGQPSARLLDLTDGTEHGLTCPGDMSGMGVAFNMLWTPDSRWLLALCSGRITVLDTTTGREVTSDLGDGGLQQISLRTPDQAHP